MKFIVAPAPQMSISVQCQGKLSTTTYLDDILKRQFYRGHHMTGGTISYLSLIVSAPSVYFTFFCKSQYMTETICYCNWLFRQFDTAMC